MPEPIQVSRESISKEEVAYWHREIESSQEFRQEKFHKRINYYKMVEYYEGIQKGSVSNEDQLSIINEIFPAIYSIIVSTYNQNPSVSVKPTHPKADKNVQPNIEFLLAPGSASFEPFPLKDLLAGAIKYLQKKTGMKEENQLALFDMLCAGFACVEVNHRIQDNTKTGGEDRFEDTDFDQIAQDLSGKVIQGAKRIGKKLLGKTTGKSDEEVAEDIAKELTTLEKQVDADSTFIKRWCPTKILFDYRAEVFKESRYIAKEVDMSIAEFKNTYPEHKDMIPEEATHEIMHSNHKVMDNRRSVRVFEIEIKEKKRNRVLVIAEGIQEALDHYERPIITNNFAIKYGSIDKYGKIYPKSRIAHMKKPQDDLNHYTTIQMEHADRALHKVGVWWEGLTEDGKNAMLDNDIFGIVPKKNPTAVFEPMPQGGATPDNLDLQNKMTENINKLGSTNELAKSGTSDSRFATQDALKQQAFQLASTGVQDALGDLLDQEVDALKDIVMQLWDGDDYFQITGLPGGDQWYDPAMGPLADLLLGDYATETNITTAQKQDPFKDRADLTELANFLLLEPVQLFLQSKGKQVNVSLIENLIKSYDQKSEAILEDADQDTTQPQQPLGPIQEQLPGEAQVTDASLGSAPQANLEGLV